MKAVRWIQIYIGSKMVCGIAKGLAKGSIGYTRGDESYYVTDEYRGRFVPGVLASFANKCKIDYSAFIAFALWDSRYNRILYYE